MFIGDSASLAKSRLSAANQRACSQRGSEAAGHVLDANEAIRDAVGLVVTSNDARTGLVLISSTQRIK